jgi:DNA-directed RNA polymerase subunit RPC12/RpoP
MELSQELKESLESLKCPRCGSGKLAFGNKGFSIGQTIAGGILVPGIGLLAGFIGRKKIEVGCADCGFRASLKNWRAISHYDDSPEAALTARKTWFGVPGMEHTQKEKK